MDWSSFTAISSRIDWAATALLLVGGLAGYIVFALRGLRRLAPPATHSPSEGAAAQVAALEQSLSEVRAELTALRETVAELKAARDMPPQYNEAMVLASRGGSAQQIADSCGISLAEAELVQALRQRGSGAKP
ncbi:MAG: DUF2802 domain-containing protein [Rhodocyclaceae bacterium]